MKVNISRSKTIFLLLLAILMAAAHPIESKESVKEIEDTEEVRLYFQEGKHFKQKPKTPLQVVSKPEASQEFNVSQKASLETLPKYILYCNLIFYE